MSKYVLLTVLVVLYFGCQRCCGQSRFTNVKCESFNKSICIFETCRLKVIKRGVISGNVYAKVLKLPVTSAMINWSVWRKYNGYKPFLYNVTHDFCKLMSQKPGMSFAKLIISALSKNSNLNHSCPYNHDIIVNNLVFSDDYFHLLPVPTGEYKFKLLFGIDHIWVAQVEAFVLRVE